MNPTTTEDAPVANPARMYDYMLGGAANLAVDRELAEELSAWRPDVAAHARANRSFLQRAVRRLAVDGTTQFLDLGSGLPTVGNVHQIAQRHGPGCRVVYVDHDPVAVSYTRGLLAGRPHTEVVAADLGEVNIVLSAAERTLDFTRPVCVLLAAVLHFLPDDADPAGIVARYRSRLAPGSHLVLSHGTADGEDSACASGLDVYRRSGSSVFLRTHQQVEAMFEGWTILDPGVVAPSAWRADDDAEPGWRGFWAGVGRLDP